jgi:predicted dienelactone hydrolase
MSRLPSSLVLAGALASACATNDPVPCSTPVLVPGDVAEAGPFRVGHRSFELSYTPPGLDAPRRITVNLWYPTQDEGGPSARYLGLQNDDAAFVDAALAETAPGCPYPVLTYSHGYAAYGGNAAHLMRHFASHGWVAAAPDHTENTFLDGDRPPGWIRYVRPHDLSAMLDALAELPSTDPLAGRLQTDRVVMTGHSYGAFTTWATAGAKFDVARIDARCAAGEEEAELCTPAARAQLSAGLRDPRVVAAIPLAGAPDPDWFGTDGPSAASVPLLELTGSEDDRGMGAVFSAATIPLTWLEFQGGCHETFTMGIDCDSFDAAEGLRLTRAYALAFARHHLLSDDDEATVALLEGRRTLSPLVTFRSK